MRRALRLIASTAAWMAVAAPLAAQAVQGELVAATTAQPVAGGLVVLLDSAGTERGRVLTDPAGRFFIRAGAAGGYRVKALQIGYRSWLSPAFRLAAGQTLVYRIEMPAVPIELAAITVEAASGCRVHPETGQGAAELWEEAQKALSATELTIAERRYRFRTATTERTLDPRLRVQTEERRTALGFSDWPFESLAPESLARRGFVQDAPGGPLYYGPDVRVLFSAAFLNTHCFRVEQPPPGNGGEGLIGLAFEPTAKRRVKDIGGVLWLDRRTAELRYLEFRYTQLEDWIPADLVGGRIEFYRLPTGGWILRRWRLRAPIPVVRPGSRELYGFREREAEVVEVFTADGRPVTAFGPAP